MKKTSVLSLAVTALLAASSAHAQDAACDRQCLKGAVDQVLESMVRHAPAALPLAAKYRLTVDNVPSGIAMTTPWRTITGIKPMRSSQYVIDVPAQQVVFTSTVMEGGMPSLLFGRVQVDHGKIDELELYLGRSKADSGMQFDPTGLANPPAAWDAPIPDAQRNNRDELTKAAKAIFNSSYGDLAASPQCELVENGKRVVARITVEALLKAFPGAPQAEIDRVRKASAHGGIVPIGCARLDPPQDPHARIVVDEQQGEIASLAMVQGKVFPNFMPPPGPDPEFPTVFVPDSMKADQAGRIKALSERPASAGVSISDAMPAALATVEIEKFYGNQIQGTHRLMQGQPTGSVSPWTLP
jgi:hypothetical protein